MDEALPLAGMAHEYNNLLTVLSGSIVLAERHAGGNEALLRLLGNMRAATDRAETLTKRLAEMGERGSPPLEAREVRVGLPDV